MEARKPISFDFVKYEFNPASRRAVFHYATHFPSGKKIKWAESVILPAKKGRGEGFIPAGLKKKILESLHLILGISYWKFHCAPRIRMPYALAEEEARFWNIVYQKGLGEFFYRNKLNPSLSPKFPFVRNKKITSYQLPVTDYSSLIGLGGGKESIVAGELLKKHGFRPTAFIVDTNGSSGLIDAVVKKMGIGALKVRRTLDPKVFNKHPYNGHIPISAIYAFLGVFLAILYGRQHVIVGNEYSSNFGNLSYKGLDINHQWSKSFEFEQLFQEYCKNFITPDVQYFSLLRPFHEIRIAKFFSRFCKKYFNVFSSCNSNFKVLRSAKLQGRAKWCGKCAKCVFTFILLSAFIPKKELLKIFGKNLYRQENLITLFKDILGFGDAKPFDCVGTFQEAQTAFAMASKRYKNDYAVKLLCDKANVSNEVFKTQRENAVLERYKFLGMENALIIGYGKEGKVTQKFIKKYYPHLKRGIADAKQGIDYLKKQANYDIAVKTPGIKKELVTIPYTTATNVFFSHVGGRNITIGVTGSKGKSTTASLICHILKAAGKDAHLLGNIGKPMLEALLKPIPKKRIFVLELSSYQLDDVAYSPNIAVITNLFPEHLDYHGTLEKYYAAKRNIYRFQKAGDCLIDRPKAARKYESNLLGRHNQNNIQAAVEVARIFKIPEPTIKKAVKNFAGLPHRLEYVGTYRGVIFYDDAISTTPESTVMAIKALKKIGTIFLGGQDRGYDFSQLEKTIRQYKIKNIVLFPDSGERMIKNESGLGILKTKSMEEAIRFGYKNTPRGAICLLSCASPSYSLWKDFEEKGDEFKKFVKKLGK